MQAKALFVLFLWYLFPELWLKDVKSAKKNIKNPLAGSLGLILGLSLNCISVNRDVKIIGTFSFFWYSKEGYTLHNPVLQKDAAKMTVKFYV